MFDKNWKVNVTSKYRYEATGVKDFIINHVQQNKIKNPVIIDVGCSYGIALEWVMTYFDSSNIKPHIIGIDASKNVRKKAEKIFDEFINTEVQKISGREKTADIVICHKAAIFVIGTRRAEIIKKCHSFLKNDGILITDVDCYPPSSLFISPFRILKSLWYLVPNASCFKHGLRNFRRMYDIRMNTLIRKGVFKLSKEEAKAYAEKILQGWNSRNQLWKLWWRFIVFQF